MKVENESAEMAIWAKLAVAFVAGLVLAGAGAMIVVKTVASKAPPAVETSSAPASTAVPVAQSVPTAAVSTPDPTPEGAGTNEPRAAAAETTAPPATHKKHPSAFGDQPSKRPAAPRNTPPVLISQAQNSPNPPQDTAPQVAHQQTAPAPPRYAPAPEVAPVIPTPNEKAAQPEVRQDNSSTDRLRQPNTVTIQAGTSLMVRMAETVSTMTKAVGDSFRGTLDRPIILNDFIIADKGSKVTGKIVSAQKGGHLSGSSDLSLEVTEIHTTDGQTVHVETSPWEKKGESNTGGNIAKIGGGAALGAIIGAIAGGGKGAAIGAGAGGAAGTGVAAATGGKPTVVPVETLIAFRLNTPVTITEQINN